MKTAEMNRMTAKEVKRITEVNRMTAKEVNIMTATKMNRMTAKTLPSKVAIVSRKREGDRFQGTAPKQMNTLFGLTGKGSVAW